MRQDRNNFISRRVCDKNNQYDEFFAAYQNNITSILNKLRRARKREQYLKRINRDLHQDNIYLKQEIHRLEDADDKVRDLLSEKSKQLIYFENYTLKNTYIIKYRLKYFDSYGEEILTEYYDSEEEALKHINNNKLFVIEKSYQKKNWYDSESEED